MSRIVELEERVERGVCRRGDDSANIVVLITEVEKAYFAIAVHLLVRAVGMCVDVVEQAVVAVRRG
jgi:hypothetical protein